MLTRTKVSAIIIAIAAGNAVSAAPADPTLLAHLRDAKLSLATGIAQAEAKEGAAISAKFEMNGDKLSLSIYTAKAGIGQNASDNVLEELAGDPTTAAWTPAVAVLSDSGDLRSAAAQLTLLQLSDLSLSDVVGRALQVVGGAAYSVVPRVESHRAFADVSIATGNDQSTTVTVDLESGVAKRTR